MSYLCSGQQYYNLITLPIQIASIISSSDTTSYLNLYTYNAEGQLINVAESNSVSGPIDKLIFLYDAQKRITKVTGTPYLANLLLNDITFTYDAANKVIGDSTHNLQTNTVATYRVFDYDNNGNINKITFFDLFSGTSQVTGTENLSYNDKLNPYYTLKDDYFYSTDDPPVLYKNMVIYTSGTDFNQYTYYSNELPRQLIYKNPLSGTEITSNYTYMP